MIVTGEHRCGWGVVLAEPGREFVAARAIRELGYEFWLPTYRKLIRGVRIDAAGHRIRTRNAGEVVDRVLIAGYFFALIPHGDYAEEVDHCDGVKRLFRHVPEYDLGWGKPKYVRAREIAILKQAIEDGLYDDVKEVRLRTDLKEGDEVRTPAGIAGTLLSLNEKGRAALFTELFGRTQIVRDVEAKTLELVE